MPINLPSSVWFCNALCLVPVWFLTGLLLCVNRCGEHPSPMEGKRSINVFHVHAFQKWHLNCVLQIYALFGQMSTFARPHLRSAFIRVHPWLLCLSFPRRTRPIYIIQKAIRNIRLRRISRMHGHAPAKRHGRASGQMVIG